MWLLYIRPNDHDWCLWLLCVSTGDHDWCLWLLCVSTGDHDWCRSPWCVAASAIGCFVCSSINHNNPECEDTFNNTGRFYDPKCQAWLTGRVGLFPATQCVKITAKLSMSASWRRQCVYDSCETWHAVSGVARLCVLGWGWTSVKANYSLFKARPVCSPTSQRVFLLIYSSLFAFNTKCGSLPTILLSWSKNRLRHDYIASQF